MTARRRPSLPRPRRRSGGGFTLVELLIVITILVILIGLLVPAVNSARTRVRHTAVQAEINRIASGIVSFKTEYGGEPPSTVQLRETGGTNGANWQSRDRAIIRQLWPQFNFGANRDINGDGDTSDTINLEPGESLVFFLGGLPLKDSSTGKFTLVGFSRNPQDPFTSAANTAANRVKSAYDFEAGRLVDLDNDGMPEFLDSYPGQTFPILYFSSYDGSGYRQQDYPGNKSPVDMTIPINPYLQGKVLTSPAFNKNTFQLISPGLDHAYGPGGPYESGSDAPLPAYNRTGTFAANVSASDRTTERDNITNFGSGPLVP